MIVSSFDFKTRIKPADERKRIRIIILDSIRNIKSKKLDINSYYAHNIHKCDEGKSIRKDDFQRAFARCEKAVASGELHPGTAVLKL